MLEQAVRNAIGSTAGGPIDALVHIYRMLTHGISVYIKPSVVVDVAAQDLHIANFTRVKPRVIIVFPNFNVIQNDVVAPVQPNLASAFSLYPAGVWSQRTLKDQTARLWSAPRASSNFRGQTTNPRTMAVSPG